MQIISTKDYLLLIDEEAEINKGCYIVARDNSGIAKVEEFKKGHIKAVTINDTDLGIGYYQLSDWIKIIAYYPLTKEAKELDLPLLPNPFKEEFDAHTFIQNEFGFTDEEMDKWRIFLNGSNLADYQNILNLVERANQCKGTFTLEDMIGFAKFYILNKAVPYELDVLSGKITDEQKIQMLQNDVDGEWKGLVKEYIQSLSVQ